MRGKPTTEAHDAPQLPCGIHGTSLNVLVSHPGVGSARTASQGAGRYTLSALDDAVRDTMINRLGEENLAEDPYVCMERISPPCVLS